LNTFIITNNDLKNFIKTKMIEEIEGALTTYAKNYCFNVDL